MKKEYDMTVTLYANEKDIEVPIHIADEELDVDAKVSIEIIYNDIKYIGTGKELNWVDAFADLQKKLPAGVFLKCCMSCKYGNLNLYGNIPNQVICSCSKSICNKEDLIAFLYAGEYDDNEKKSTYVCENFDFANKEHYTYNDFLHYLEH